MLPLNSVKRALFWEVPTVIYDILEIRNLLQEGSNVITVTQQMVNSNCKETGHSGQCLQSCLMESLRQEVLLNPGILDNPQK